EVSELPACRAAVESFKVQKNRLILPLTRGRILLFVIHRKAEVSHLAAVGEGANLWVTGQSADQHHFVQVRHGCTLPSTVEEGSRVAKPAVVYIRLPSGCKSATGRFWRFLKTDQFSSSACCRRGPRRGRWSSALSSPLTGPSVPGSSLATCRARACSSRAK